MTSLEKQMDAECREMGLVGRNRLLLLQETLPRGTLLLRVLWGGVIQNGSQSSPRSVCAPTGWAEPKVTRGLRNHVERFQNKLWPVKPIWLASTRPKACILCLWPITRDTLSFHSIKIHEIGIQSLPMG